MNKLIEDLRILEEKGLHPALISLTVNDFERFNEECEISSRLKGTVSKFKGVPVMMSQRFKSSSIITQEDIIMLEANAIMKQRIEMESKLNE